MFARFALCLAPLFLAGVLAPLYGFTMGKNNDPAGMLIVIFLLIAVGALLSGYFVSRLVYRGITDPAWLRWVASILVFLLVAAGYLGLGFFGGCFLLLTTAN